MKSKLLVFACLLILCAPLIVLGQGGGADSGQAGNTPGFISLVGIPGIDPNDPGLGNYINALYRLSISLAALLAVVKIVIAGAKYMLDDIVTHKEEAKADIWGAVTGLLVILAAVLILTTINSDLTKTDFIVDTVTFDPLVNTPQSQYAACAQSGDCTVTDCTIGAGGGRGYPGISEYLPADTEKTCAAQCTTAGGLYLQITGKDRTTCQLSKSAMDELVATYEAALVNKLCPAGKDCYAESCSVYGVGYVTCSSPCESEYKGTFDELTKTCVMPGKKADITTTVTCTGTIDFIGSKSGGGTVDNRCKPQKEACYDGGGYPARSDGTTLVCRTPKTDFTCPDGQSPVTREGEENCVDGVCTPTQITVCE